MADIYAKYDIAFDPDQPVIAEATCVIHPEGVETFDHVKRIEDDIPVAALEAFNIVGKPVTIGHGKTGPDGWLEMPKVVGVVAGKRMDEDGRLLGLFNIFDTPCGSGKRVLDDLLKRKLRDVSPLICHNLSKMIHKDPRAYSCNHLALCNWGRRNGTHILAVRSNIPESKSWWLKNPSIRGKNASTSKASKLLFNRSCAPGMFFTANSRNETDPHASWTTIILDQADEEESKTMSDQTKEPQDKMDMEEPAAKKTSVPDDEAMETEIPAQDMPSIPKMPEEQRARWAESGIDPDAVQEFGELHIRMMDKAETDEERAAVERMFNLHKASLMAQAEEKRKNQELARENNDYKARNDAFKVEGIDNSMMKMAEIASQNPLVLDEASKVLPTDYSTIVRCAQDMEPEARGALDRILRQATMLSANSRDQLLQAVAQQNGRASKELDPRKKEVHKRRVDEMMQLFTALNDVPRQSSVPQSSFMPPLSCRTEAWSLGQQGSFAQSQPMMTPNSREPAPFQGSVFKEFPAPDVPDMNHSEQPSKRTKTPSLWELANDLNREKRSAGRR